MVQLQHNNTILFIGDSITDAGRNNYFEANLGQGYVNMIAGQLYRQYIPLQLNILNRGVGGNILADLIARWQEDCLDLKPDIVSLQIGINDIWYQLSDNIPYSEAFFQQFKKQYEFLIQSLKDNNIQIILLEPYVLPFPEDRKDWRPFVDKAIQIVKALAKEYGATFIPLDAALNQAGDNLGYETITGIDGVHPTNIGHAFIADQWLRHTGL